ncbi:ceramide synthase 1-like [Oppia nitens]|uniref:ceramide synthase 1-like n=1 Tax=Oppia nitens TaxID=1686743 RepID=UPI0023DA3ACE|nr:ceramide synthase 1-like [Oppia nitens]
MVTMMLSTTTTGLTSDPSFMDIIQSTALFASENYLWLKSNYKFPDNTLDDLRECGQRLATADCIAVVVLAIGWTIGRYLTSKYIFRPFAQSIGSNIRKFSESSWKVSYYIFTTTFLIYLLFGQNCCHYFTETQHIWSDYSMDDTVPTNVRLLYLVEISFYIHSIYAVLVLDEWRKDTLVMFSHHIVTLVLLAISLLTSAHRVGLIVLLTHDSCDIWLELGKCLLTMKHLTGLYGQLANKLIGLNFILFATSWIICRLYWFPLKAIYTSAVYFTDENNQKFPFMLLLFTMLWIILAMDIYWFMLIIKATIKVIIGKSYIEDPRDLKTLSSNGYHKTHQY